MCNLIFGELLSFYSADEESKYTMAVCISANVVYLVVQNTKWLSEKFIFQKLPNNMQFSSILNYKRKAS